MFNRELENSYIGLGDGSVFCYNRMQRLVPNTDKVYFPVHDPAFYAWALSKVRRWNGNVPISVAEHTFMVSNCAKDIAVRQGCDGRIVLACAYFGLHHDDHEAVFSDVPRPVKQMYPEIKTAEDVIESVFYSDNAALFPIKLSASEKIAVMTVVKAADTEVNIWEGRTYLPNYTSKFVSDYTHEQMLDFSGVSHNIVEHYMIQHHKLVRMAQSFVAVAA